MNLYDIAIARKLSGGGGGDAEVWLVGDSYTDDEGVRYFELSNVGTTNHMRELSLNGDKYTVYLNGEEMSCYEVTGTKVYGGTLENLWFDSDDEQARTIQLGAYIYNIEKVAENVEADVVYLDASTAPTSVEVSVKAK